MLASLLELRWHNFPCCIGIFAIIALELSWDASLTLASLLSFF
jgi:hypothetical protein